MSDWIASGALDGTTFQRIAAGHGIALTSEESAQLATQVWPRLEALRAVTASLCADDDMLAFRRLLEQEAARA